MQNSCTHLFNGVQRNGNGYDRHQDNSSSIVVVLFSAPQNHTEQLENVKRIQHLESRVVTLLRPPHTPKAMQVGDAMIQAGSESLFPAQLRPDLKNACSPFWK